ALTAACHGCPRELHSFPTRRSADLHPFPTPSAQMSRPYTNPDGVTMGPCLYCGFCMNYACEVSAKATPRTRSSCRSRSRGTAPRSEEHTSELQSRSERVCRLLLEKK